MSLAALRRPLLLTKGAAHYYTVRKGLKTQRRIPAHRTTAYNRLVPSIKNTLIFLLAVSGLTAFALILQHFSIAPLPVLNPSGAIAIAERNLIITSTLLMLIVVVPVFFLTFFFSWKYRATNARARYTPNWEHNTFEEFIWWAVPCVIILVLANITWRTSHALDPYKPIDSGEAPLQVQVVALNWKWLFIYPEEKIASVNYLEIPAHRPIHFRITADAPMNSFWIPALAGQIYAMAGMTTQLHAIANSPGEFEGSSANFSGSGFAGMKFVTHAVPQHEFDAWVDEMHRAPLVLDIDTYTALAAPSENISPIYFSWTEPGLFDHVIKKYMIPFSPETSLSASPDMNMEKSGGPHVQ